jgi:hypothetical protein
MSSGNDGSAIFSANRQHAAFSLPWQRKRGISFDLGGIIFANRLFRRFEPQCALNIRKSEATNKKGAIERAISAMTGSSVTWSKLCAGRFFGRLK